MTSSLGAFKALGFCLFWPLIWSYVMLYFLSKPHPVGLAKKVMLCYFLVAIGAPIFYYFLRGEFSQPVITMIFGFFSIVIFQDYFIKNKTSTAPTVSNVYVNRWLLYTLALIYNGVFPLGIIGFAWLIISTPIFFAMPTGKIIFLCSIALAFGIAIIFRNMYPKCSNCRFPLLRVDTKNQNTLIFNVDVFRGRTLHCPRCHAKINFK